MDIMPRLSENKLSCKILLKLFAIYKEGFSIEEIEENCTLFINGHLHNFSTVGNNIVNLGNITGQNFSEDGYAYPHQCMILDTVKREIEYIENPFALYFYKLDFTKYSDSDQDCKQMAEVLDLLKPTSVITVKVDIFASQIRYNFTSFRCDMI